MQGEKRGYWRYWGKAQRPTDSNSEASYHLLPYHCLDVAAVAECWWNNSPALRGALIHSSGCDEKQVRAWLLFFIALHDYGKLDVRFQRKSKETMQTVWPEFDAARTYFRGLDIKNYFHGPAGFSWFRDDFNQVMGWGVEDEFERWDEVWVPWLAAVTGHHGAIPRSCEESHYLGKSQAHKTIIEHDLTARIQWVETLERLFLNPVGLSTNDSPPAYPPLLAGFCSVCDWLGSDSTTGRFEYAAEVCDEEGLKAYFQHAQAIAAKSLIASGLLGHKQPYQNVAALLPMAENGDKPQPRQLQTLVDKLPIMRGLSVIEAPTGSGKTEAALAYAWRLLDAGLADSIVFALPTQATANAMLDRVGKIASLLFEEQPNLVLAHGKAKFNDTFWNLKEAANKQTAQEGDEARAQCAGWLSASRKRVFLGQIGVCTIDQVLVSVLPVRHNFVRGFGVGKSVLIVDEVHAYDFYMYGLLDEVLKVQRASGGSAILLSATLPAQQRQMLLSAWQAKGDAPPVALYPLISHCGQVGEVTFFDLPEDEQPSNREVEIDILPKPDLLPYSLPNSEEPSLIEQMLQAAEQGAQVVFICNLVDVAQGLAKTLADIGRVPVELFHARYRFGDRQKKEKKVMDYFGKEGKQRGQGRILVATQVVEQSLDLDFDWMLTQLCPVDLLFQRLGRLHRHSRPRPPGFEQARCTVLIPDNDDYGLHAVIYGNTRVLWRTAQLLLKADGKIEFPKAYRTWIEQVYQEKPWPDEPEAMTKSYTKFWEDAEASRMNARRIVQEKPGEFTDTDDHVSLLTRDGEMNLNLLPVQETQQGQCLLDGRLLESLGDEERDEYLNINTVSVPNTWRGWLKELPSKDGLILLPMTLESDIWEVKLDRCRLSYSEDLGLRLFREA